MTKPPAGVPGGRPRSAYAPAHSCGSTGLGLVCRAGEAPGGPVPSFAVGRSPSMEPGDEELSGLLDEGGELLPLLTLGEARVLLHVAHLLGLGDAEAADAAREMETRLTRRLQVMFPSNDVLLQSVQYSW